MILKTSGNIKFITLLKKCEIGFGIEGKAKRDGRYKLVGGEISGGKVGSNEFGNNEVGNNNPKMFKSKKLSKSKKTVKSSDFLTFKTRLAFTQIETNIYQSSNPPSFWFGMSHLDWNRYICNNVTFEVENSQSRSHMTTTNYNFILSGLTSIKALGSSSFMPKTRWYVYLWKGIPLDAY